MKEVANPFTEAHFHPLALQNISSIKKPRKLNHLSAKYFPCLDQTGEHTGLRNKRNNYREFTNNSREFKLTSELSIYSHER